MTVDPAYDAAVEIAVETLARLGYGPDLPYDFYAVLAALDRAGLLHDPRRVAALGSVAEAARAALDVDPTSRAGAEVHIRLEAALDAVSVAEGASGERARPVPLPDPNVLPHTDGWEIRGNVFVTHVVDVRPMTDDEQRAEQLTPDPREPWLAKCTCGAGMLPLLPGEANAWEQGHLGTRPWAQA